MAKARVDVEVNGAKFKTGLAEMQKDFREFSGFMTETAVKTGELIGVALGAEMFRTTLDNMDRVAKQSEKFGESAETIQRLDMAAKNLGVDMTQITTLMSRLERSIETSAAGGRDLTKVWQYMGMSAGDFAKLGMEDRLIALSRGFEEAEKKGESTYVLTQLLGRSGADMIPILAAGPVKLKEIFDATTVATQTEVDEMERAKMQADQWTQSLEVGLVRGVNGLKFALTSLMIAVGEVDTAWIKFLNHLDLVNDDTVAKSQKSLNDYIASGVKQVTDFADIDINGNPLAPNAERLAQRKASQDALSATLDDDSLPDKKLQKELAQSAEEKVIQDQLREDDRRNAEIKRNDATVRKNLEEQSLDEDTTDPKNRRAVERGQIQINQQQDLTALKEFYTKKGMLREEDWHTDFGDQNDYYAEARKLTDEYMSKKALIISEGGRKIASLDKEDKDQDLKEAEQLSKTKRELVMSDFEARAMAEHDPVKRRSIQREAIKAEADAELSDLKKSLTDKLITQAQYEASAALIASKAKQENTKLDNEVMGRFNPMDFDVDSFRSRGGSGARFGLGQGGGMSPELNAMLKTATNSEESVKALHRIETKIGKGKGFK